MALLPSLQLKQQQKLVMTPMLQQALKILQLNNLELSDLIQQECAENPFLEDEASEDAVKPGAEEEAVIKEEAKGAEEPVREEAAAETSAPEGELPEAQAGLEAPASAQAEGESEITIGERGMQLDENWQDYFTENGSDYAANYEAPDEEKDTFENFVSRPPSLQDHLLAQMDALELPEKKRDLVEEIIGALDERGYFLGDLAELAQQKNCDKQEIFQALMLVQGMEPAGVGSRDLRECLLLQLQALGQRDSLAWKLVSEYLKEVEKKKNAWLAHKLGVDLEDIEHAENIIASLEPNPGRPFGGALNSTITVDAVVEKDEEGNYRVVVLDSQLPRLGINNYYKRMLKEAGREKDATHQYLQDKYQSAVWLIRSIQQRHKTLQRVIESIVEVQKDFLDQGVTAFKPLTLKEIAARTGLHESTVSRVTTNKYVETPRGIFELKFFFSGGFKTDQGDETASIVVKEKLKGLIESEDSRHPHSDQHLADLLAEQGIQIARRTVAKYREELKIFPANQRKKA